MRRYAEVEEFRPAVVSWPAGGVENCRAIAPQPIIPILTGQPTAAPAQ
jgi:hypothetical protein